MGEATDNTTESVGSFLRHLRRRAGYTSVQAAAADLGWSESMVGHVETARRRAGRDLLDQMIVTYKASVEEASILRAMWVEQGVMMRTEDRIDRLEAEVQALRRAVRELQAHARLGVESELDATPAVDAPAAADPSPR